MEQPTLQRNLLEEERKALEEVDRGILTLISLYLVRVQSIRAEPGIMLQVPAAEEDIMVVAQALWVERAEGLATLQEPLFHH